MDLDINIDTGFGLGTKYKKQVEMNLPPPMMGKGKKRSVSAAGQPAVPRKRAKTSIKAVPSGPTAAPGKEDGRPLRVRTSEKPNKPSKKSRLLMKKKKKTKGKDQDDDEEPPEQEQKKVESPVMKPKVPVMAAFTGAKAGQAGKKGVTTGASFQKLKLHDALRKQLEFLKFVNTTPVQDAALPPALQGRDVLLRAPTGSGKTLAFLLPILHRLLELKPEGHSREKGTLAVVLSPTKELALQTLKVAQDLVRMVPSLVCGAVAGGEKPKSEKARLRKGMPLLCATPGRLTYHLEHTNSMLIGNLFAFVLDEADRLLDMGFEPQIRKIFKRIVKEEATGKVQTLLASATLNPNVRRLAQFCLRDNAHWADPQDTKQGKKPQGGDREDDEANFSVPSTLTQWYCIVPCKERLVTLLSAIVSKVADAKNDGKAIVFFSTGASVDFHHDLFVAAGWPERSGFRRKRGDTSKKDGVRNLQGGFVGMGEEADDDEAEEEAGQPADDRPKVLEGTRLFKLHGNLSKEERAGYINDFSKAGRGALLASDAASRGLDFPKIDWIIQYDPPQRIEEYLHRVGRTARIGNAGNALIFLQPSETGFLDVLKSKGLKDFRELSAGQLHNELLCSKGAPQELTAVRDLPTFFTADLASYVGNTPALASQARSAFLAAYKAYRTFPRELRSSFPIGQLHHGHFAASFALREAPTQASKEVRRAAGVDEGKGRGRGRGRGRGGGAGRSGGRIPAGFGAGPGPAAPKRPRVSVTDEFAA